MRLNLSMSTGNLCRAGVVRTPYPTSKQLHFDNDDGDEEDDTDDEGEADLVSIKTRSGRRNVLVSCL